MQLTQEIATVLSGIGKVGAIAGSVSGTNSLSKLAKVALVKPLCIIDSDIARDEITPQIVNAALNLFIGHYTTAFKLYGTIDGLKIASYLDRFNPERSFIELYPMLESDRPFEPSLENGLKSLSDGRNYNYKLPNPYTPTTPQWRPPLPVTSVSVEAYEGKGKIEEFIDEIADNDLVKTIRKPGDSKDTTPSATNATKLSDVYKSGDLFVGKVVDVTMTVNSEAVTIPITFNVSAVPLPSKVVTTMLTTKRQDTIVEKWHGWRSGQKEFWSDLVFNNQLVKEHQRALMEDTTNTYSAIHARATKNAAAALLSQTPSLATASNIYILSEATMQQIEIQSKGMMRDTRFRNKLFDRIMASIIVVVSRRYETVTIYENGADRPTSLMYAQVPKMGGAPKDDIGDIFKSVLQQRPMSMR